MVAVQVPGSQWYEFLDRFTRMDELLAQILGVLQQMRQSAQQPGIQPISLPGVPTIDSLIEELKVNRLAGYWFLPHSNNLDFEFKQQKNLEIGAGELQTLADIEEPGWFMSGYITGNSGKLRVASEMRFIGGVFSGNATAEELDAQGLTAPNPFQLWCPKHDTVTPVSTVAFTPSPWMPFKNRLRVTVKNEDVATKKYSATIHILLVKGVPSKAVETI